MGADEATVDMPFTEQIIVARQQNFYHTFWQTVTMGWGLMLPTHTMCVSVSLPSSSLVPPPLLPHLRRRRRLHKERRVL